MDVDDSTFQRQDDDAYANEKNADPLSRGRSFPQKQDRKESYEQEAQLIDGCDLRGLAHFQGPKVANPGGPGRQPGQNQKKPGLGVKFERVAAFSGEVDEAREHNQDHNGANERGEI